jgi:mono/diheme cytochrome c family protein
VWVLALAVGSFLAACGSNGGPPAASSPPALTGAQRGDAQLRQGRQVFAARCAECHGMDGGGGVGPSFHGRVLLRDFPEARDQVALVESGRGVMPAFGATLSRAEIEAVVRYEREILTVRKP